MAFFTTRQTEIFFLIEGVKIKILSFINFVTLQRDRCYFKNHLDYMQIWQEHYVL